MKSAAATPPPTLDQRLLVRRRPDRRPVMYHSWRDLLFLHWRIDPKVIQSTLPAGLYVDTFDGDAWVAIVPFFMNNIRPTWFPAVPGISQFQETNVRTYVYNEHGTPGVWFYSLDANSWPGVKWGRTFFGLSYHWARMSASRDDTSHRIDYRTHRRRTPRNLSSHFIYSPEGAAVTAEPGSLEFFLAERYVLFSHHRGRHYSGIVSHPPYPVSSADVSCWDDNLIHLAGLPTPGRAPDHILMSRGVEVEVFPLERV